MRRLRQDAARVVDTEVLFGCRRYPGGCLASTRRPSIRPRRPNFSPQLARDMRRSLTRRRSQRLEQMLAVAPASPAPSAGIIDTVPVTDEPPEYLLRPKSRSLPYLPALDGLRALAVIAVLIFHGHAQWLPGGFLGVDIFFVISGFIITRGLL